MAKQMKQTIQWITILSVLVWAAGAAVAQTDLDKPERLGDFQDGSQSNSVHHIGLYDDEGFPIFPGVNDDKPFSTFATCIGCHQIEDITRDVDGKAVVKHGISSGWHFNQQIDPNDQGPSGEPWIYWDCATGTQLPISDRAWAGTFTSEQAGLTPWWKTRIFGRHMPGGGSGVQNVDADLNVEDDWASSGDLQINCLACHDAEPLHDQAQQALLLKHAAFKWAGAATSAFAYADVAHPADRAENFADLVPGITYDENRFFAANKVRMDLRAEAGNERCLFCHSTAMAHGDDESWQQDVHMAAGLSCVDCHTNGLDHQITRGYETEAELTGREEAATVSCKGCHLGTDDEGQPTAGRLGAPYPEHKGIPTVHFEKLSCTACHSGPWPEATTVAVKTSRAHALGTRQINQDPNTLPHIQMPVFVPGSDNKIAPHKLVWPSFWAWQTGDEVTPVPVLKIRDWAGRLLKMDVEIDQMSWPQWSQQDVINILTALQDHAEDGAKAVYVSGGKLYSVDGQALASEDSDAAKPYTWPVAHNVRPASQALGVRACQDCHDLDAGLMFGQVAVDGPLADPNATITMVDMQDIDPQYASLFARTFVFRPMLKVVAFMACALIGLILVAFGVKAVEQVACVTGRPVSVPFNWTGLFKTLASLGALVCVAVMAITGFAPGTIHGYGLMLHATCAPVFILCVAYLALAKAKSNACAVSGIGLIRAICFWVLVVLSIPLTLSIAVSMLPLFGTHMQHVLAWLHSTIALLFVIIAVVYAICAFASKESQ